MRRPWKAAVWTAALTSLLFVVVYNLCNRVTQLRPDVAVWAFEWEKAWPLVPLMIVPYWSIDLLFVLAPFLARDEAALKVYRRRMIFVICGAACGFLLIPLQFAFPRPRVEGPLGGWFQALYSFDLPHNLFPSLHIALRTVLTDFYVRRAEGWWRWPVHVWFSLIGLSTLLTWQHHLVDVVGGFWLAAIALHLFPVSGPVAPRATNHKIAWIYAAVAVISTQAARLSWPWTFVFVWPAFAFGAAAYSYLGHGSFYRKVGGKLTLGTRRSGCRGVIIADNPLVVIDSVPPCGSARCSTKKRPPPWWKKA
jgi:membrane-associated phospholipid phosphatase